MCGRVFCMSSMSMSSINEEEDTCEEEEDTCVGVCSATHLLNLRGSDILHN